MNKTVKFVWDHFEEVLAGAFLMVTTILVLVNVFLRYFMNTGLYWRGYSGGKASCSGPEYSESIGSAGAFVYQCLSALPEHRFRTPVLY